MPLLDNIKNHLVCIKSVIIRIYVLIWSYIILSMAEKNLFYILKDNCLNLHDTLDAVIVFGAMKQLRDPPEHIYDPTFVEIIGCFDSQKGWFKGDCTDKVLAALDNLAKYNLVDKDKDGISYSLSQYASDHILKG